MRQLRLFQLWLGVTMPPVKSRLPKRSQARPWLIGRLGSLKQQVTSIQESGSSEVLLGAFTNTEFHLLQEVIEGAIARLRRVDYGD